MTSTWRRYGLLLLALMLFILIVAQPLQPLTLWLATPFILALYWYGVRLYRQGAVARGLSLQADGRLRWWQSEQPAGQLIAGCLVSEFALLLRWRSDNNKRHLQWLLADQLSVADYRALARQLNQFNWQRTGVQPDS
ncbi:protein YgfX [Arsukibacterium sp.]|uniref:protein YgfX n=1 Tax=Arsukibacterium sp. TaxID=1977258 RepID=UPI00299E7231|nr:protein YgfX [Arsukibacterium sp.]MDX1536697.1 protein YgfX [Arsukibacterium sp.]